MQMFYSLYAVTGILLTRSYMQAGSPQKSFLYTEKDFKRIAALIHREAGIHLEDRKKDMVYARLSSRLRTLSMDSFAQYCTFIEEQVQGSPERDTFVSALTTNVTSFFREAHHFTLLQETLKELSAILPPQQPLMLWSAACSTGEEAYTIAMNAAEILGHERPFKILATDIDHMALKTAKAGIYKQESLSDAPAFASRYVTPSENGYITVNDTLKRCITFKTLNLIHPWPMRKQYHAVFCRNVMIYFDHKTTTELLSHLGNIIAPNGLLCIGHSENYAHYAQDCLRRCGPTAYRKEVV